MELLILLIVTMLVEPVRFFVTAGLVFAWRTLITNPLSLITLTAAGSAIIMAILFSISQGTFSETQFALRLITGMVAGGIHAMIVWWLLRVFGYIT